MSDTLRVHQPGDAEPISHPEIEALLGAFALDAVDGHEAEVVSSHLPTCPRCRSEVADHREVAAALGNVGTAAPSELWESIQASLEEPPPELRLTRVLPPPRRQRSLRIALVAAAVAAVAGVTFAVGAEIHALQHRVNGVSTAVSDHGLQQVVAAALVDPSAQRVDLRSPVSGYSAEAVVLSDGHGYLTDANLPPLSRSMTYQLWAVEPTGQRISLGTLGPRPGLSPFSISAGSGATTLAVTAEAASGAVVSTRSALAWGPLTGQSQTLPASQSPT